MVRLMRSRLTENPNWDSETDGRMDTGPQHSIYRAASSRRRAVKVGHFGGLALHVHAGRACSTSHTQKGMRVMEGDG